MSSRKIRRFVAAVILVSSAGLLTPLQGEQRALPRRAAVTAGVRAGAWTWRHPLWHLLTMLRARSGAKIDGNG